MGKILITTDLHTIVSTLYLSDRLPLTSVSYTHLTLPTKA